MNQTPNSVPDFSSSVVDEGEDTHRLALLVGGMRCASCAFMIENVLAREADVEARVNLTEKRLSVKWKGGKDRFKALLQPVFDHGYTLSAMDENAASDAQKKEERFLLTCLMVSGFGTIGVMLFSESLWIANDVGAATRDFLHWCSALIALPSVVYAGQPFFRSAWSVLKKGHTNMDVPISLAVILSSLLGIIQTIHHAEHAYFDSGVMLLFFLLIGRYLDFKTRGRARSAAHDLLLMMSGVATVIKPEGHVQIPVKDLKQGMVLQVAAGEKILADGVVMGGVSEVDTALLTGETLPQNIKEGSQVFAGMINLSAPITLMVSGARNETLLSEIIGLMEKAEQGQAKYVRIADRVARAYTPVVHILALAAFIGWMMVGAGWLKALLVSISVLIITCPCALGLAVPVVQVLASNRLFRKGILLKSADALERMEDIDTIVFDKTGTLTQGRPRLINGAAVPEDVMRKAASLAKLSRHPLARALNEFYAGETEAVTAREISGQGMEADVNGAIWRLGRREFCNPAQGPDDEMMEIWFSENGAAPTRFVFDDAPRSDAAQVLQQLRDKGYHLALLSGDRASVAERVGKQLGFEDIRGSLNPKMKHDAVQEMVAAGHKVLYVGDGLNDAAALAAANVSISPSSAMDITQNAASMVFQGEKLQPVLTALEIAKRAQNLVKQNFVLAIGYNIFAVPLAMAGVVTPMIAAIAMSASSIIVILNALRLQQARL